MRNGGMKCNVFDFDHAFGKNMIDVNLWVSGNISVQGHKVLFFFC